MQHRKNLSCRPAAECPAKYPHQTVPDQSSCYFRTPIGRVHSGLRSLALLSGSFVYHRFKEKATEKRPISWGQSRIQDQRVPPAEFLTPEEVNKLSEFREYR